MLQFLLRGYLVYLSFVQPVIYGAQLCHSPDPDPLQVTNVTLTLIFSWLLEVADIVFLSSFIAMRWLHLCARIVLALYFAHPRFLGAVQIYRKLFARLVDCYSPAIDAIVVRHVETIGESGLMQYGAMLTTGAMRGVAAVAGIAKTLLEASTTTSVPPAALPRRMSQARDAAEDNSGGGGGTDDAVNVRRREAAREVVVMEAALPPPRGGPLHFSPRPPAARARPVQPPSLFDEESASSPASSSPPVVHYDVVGDGEEADYYSSSGHNNHSNEVEELPPPRWGRGALNRHYQEPETVVNRGRFKANYTDTYDS